LMAASSEVGAMPRVCQQVMAAAAGLCG